MTETGSDKLPSWLSYDPSTHLLFGVPSTKDRGTYILSAAEEIFAVTVSESLSNQVAQPTNSDEQILCKPHESVTVVYVKLNKDVQKLPTFDKTHLIQSVSDHLFLKPHLISLTSRPSDLVDSSSALVAGPGDSALTNADSLSSLSWLVGCGAVKSHHMDILEKLESSAKNGDLSKKLNVPVVGWQVQSNQPKIIKNRRLKRNVRATNTIVPTEPTAGEYHRLSRDNHYPYGMK